MPKPPASDNLRGTERLPLTTLARILDQVPVGVFLGAPHGELEYLNRSLSELIQADERRAAPTTDTLRHRISEAIRCCVLTGRLESRRMAGPQEMDLLVRIFPVRDQAGKTFETVGLVEDLSSVLRSNSKLEKKVGELSIICERGKVLRSTLKMEEVLGIVLTAVTAGQGLGFNRAFLLLANDAGTVLEGTMALGPSSPEEAQRIWESLSAKDQSLEEVLRSYRSALKEEDAAVNTIVKELRIPLSREKDPLIRSMREKKAFVVNPGQAEADDGLFQVLGTDQFAVAPLISESRMLGAVVADNLITRKPVGEDDVKLLSICAHHASIAIEKSRLYQELEEKVSRLAEANKRIAEGSRRLLKVEKLSILGQITSQLAHELRNPMTIIGGFARSILRKMDQGNPDSEYLRIMVKETERMENVINNVLDFSNPDSVKREMVSLNELVEQTFEMMETEIDSDRISVSVFPCERLPLISANPELIRHALLNIFRNALWAMPNGGMLSVATGIGEKSARLEIKDTGFGICAEHMSKVFDAFFTTNSEACGLGLTIASQIIKNHGGDIGVESKRGLGSTFYIELPLTQNGEEKKTWEPQ